MEQTLDNDALWNGAPRDGLDRNDALDSILRLRPSHTFGSEHVVDVRLGFAERKAHLVGIESPREDHRHKLGRRSRPGVACLRKHATAILMMGHELRRTWMQPVEWQLLTREDENVSG